MISWAMSADSIHSDTIIAVATAPGRGAVGIVRVSGPNALPILKKFCRSAATSPASPGIHSIPDFSRSPRKQFFCSITDAFGADLDTGLVVFFPGPRSYTGEDTAEFSLHGSRLLLRDFVRVVTDSGLARPADAGEFTRRAFLNGKMDLAQAEAVRRIVDARSEFELKSGRRALAGELSRMVSRFRSALIGLKAETEAEVDFSDEDLTFETRERRRLRVQSLLDEIEKIVEGGQAALRLADGFQIALAGVPNAGKSSLLNRMLGWDRSIVSETPGTTRDYVTEEFQIDGVSVRLVDTAGLRDTGDSVEEEGVRRSKKEIHRSEIVLHVIDGSRPDYAEPFEARDNVIDVVNKSDKLHPESGWERVKERGVLISCNTGEGLESLRAAIHARMFAGASHEPMLVEERQRYHFLKIREALRTVLTLWNDNAPDEITAIEIDRALEHCGEITGRISTEEILGRIFSLFCVGK